MGDKHSDLISREVFEVHVMYIKAQLSEIQSSIAKSNAVMDAQGQTLLRNTITVEEHQRRSNLLEEQQQEALKTMQIIAESIKNLSGVVSEIEKDLIPIKETNAKANKALNVVFLVDRHKWFIFKIVGLLFIIALTSYTSAIESKSIIEAVRILLK